MRKPTKAAAEFPHAESASRNFLPTAIVNPNSTGQVMVKYPQLYRESLALLTDFYQLTMAYGYWKEGLQNKEAVFHYFFRHAPFQGGFTVSAGLEHLMTFIEEFRFE